MRMYESTRTTEQQALEQKHYLRGLMELEEERARFNWKNSIYIKGKTEAD